MELSKETTKRKQLELINSQIEEDHINCYLQAFWDEEEIDEWEDDGTEPIHYIYQYKTLKFHYAVPLGVDIRTYLKDNLNAVKQYVQSCLNEPLAKRLNQQIIQEWKDASTVPQLKTVLRKVLGKLMWV